MNLKFYHFFILLLIISSCKQEQHLDKIKGGLIPITDSLETNVEIDEFIKPYRERLNKDMDSILAYASNTYDKKDGELNTAIGNLMADVVYEQANPIFKSRTGNNIDLVMLNHGGIRSIISKGDIKTITAFEVMPFENSIVVVKLKGENINRMVDYLINRKRAHPISKIKITLDGNYDLTNALVNGKPIDTSKTYFLATNDYLYNGGDGMSFFKPNDSVYDINYKIRNALLDYFKKVDTINPVIDDRFVRLN